MSRRLILAGAAALGAALPLLAAPAAMADETGSALISLDGSSFSRAPQGSIFADGMALVPGGTATGTFYVKNDSERAADLRISVAGASSASVTLLDELSLRATTPATANSRAVPLSTDSACIGLLSGEVLGSGQVTAVRITLAMDADAGNGEQGEAADAALMVSLTDPTAPDAAVDGCTDGGGIPLLPAPNRDRPMSDTMDPVPAVDAPQPTAAAHDAKVLDKTSVTPPAVETPPTAGAFLPGPADWPLSLPWLGTGGLLLGGIAYLLMQLRTRRPG